LAGGSNANWKRRIASVVGILVGATLGAVLLKQVGLAAPLGLAALLILAATVIAARHRDTAAPLAG
jgi:predicted MFS family arabinose efflux permease